MCPPPPSPRLPTLTPAGAGAPGAGKAPPLPHRRPLAPVPIGTTHGTFSTSSPSSSLTGHLRPGRLLGGQEPKRDGQVRGRCNRPGERWSDGGGLGQGDSREGVRSRGNVREIGVKMLPGFLGLSKGMLRCGNWGWRVGSGTGISASVLDVLSLRCL